MCVHKYINGRDVDDRMTQQCQWFGATCHCHHLTLIHMKFMEFICASVTHITSYEFMSIDPFQIIGHATWMLPVKAAVYT